MPEQAEQPHRLKAALAAMSRSIWLSIPFKMEPEEGGRQSEWQPLGRCSGF